MLNDVDGIVQMIEKGTTVIMDRYYFSSYAYQSVDVPMDWVIQANALSSGILRPKVNIFLDVDVDDALERITNNRHQTELFEEKTRLIQVRERYMEAFERLQDTENVVIVDGGQPPEDVAEKVWEIVQEV